MRSRIKIRRKYSYRRNGIWQQSRKYKRKYRTFTSAHLIKMVFIMAMIVLIFSLMYQPKKKGNTQLQNDIQELMYSPVQQKIADFNISPAIIDKIFDIAKNSNKNTGSLLASYIVQKEKGKADEKILKNVITYKPSIFSSRNTKTMYKQAKECYTQFIEDIKIFPIPAQYEYIYENSWNAERVYGGIRRHYGIDIMDVKNQRGNIPIVSMSQGTIESIGWNNRGGYRVGVRTKSGGYIYYAHLDQYAPNIKKGTKLQVGDCIGYMGDSGYGKEGTVGEFPVHLHIGIATKALGYKEAWINPYYILQYLENKKIEMQPQ